MSLPNKGKSEEHGFKRPDGAKYCGTLNKWAAFVISLDAAKKRLQRKGKPGQKAASSTESLVVFAD